MGEKRKILVSDKVADAGLQILQKVENVEVVNKPGMSEAELLEEIKDAVGLLIRSGTQVTPKVLDAAPNLQVIARAGIGVDNVDIDAATQKGVVVMNTPGGNAVTTAEHAIAMMMALCRHISKAHASLLGGNWDRKSFVGTELRDKTLGVVGLGNVGREVAKRAQGLAMKVVGFDPFVTEEVAKSWGVQLVELDELFEKADLISIHTVLNDETKHLINAKNLEKMKTGVRIINCARGPIIDDDALLKAIEAGKVAGAALDVFHEEPPPKDHPLVHHPNVLATPHLGASTKEAQENVIIAAAEQLATYLRDGVAINGINVPAVSREVLLALSDYLELARRIGKFVGQLDLGSVQRVQVEVAGDILKYDTSPLSVSALHGLMSCLSEGPVNFVNASLLAERRGIKIQETRTSSTMNFANLITMTVETKKGTVVVSGTLFGKGRPKIVRLNEMFFDVVPEGTILLIENKDIPGVIGHWGTILGKRKINISQAQVAHDKDQAEALSVVNVDSDVPEDVLEELRSAESIKSVRQVRL